MTPDSAEAFLQAVRVVDMASPWHGQTVRIRVAEGRIAQITATDEPSRACVSPGWVDMAAELNDPGREDRETLAQLASAAQRGGFTDVLLWPTSQPVVDNAAVLSGILRQSGTLPVSIHFAGAVSRDLRGEAMAELYELADAGVLAFTDGSRPVEDDLLLQQSLQYLTPKGLPLLQFAHSRKLASGVANESPFVTSLGLKPISAYAEERTVMLSILALKHFGGRLHLGPISSAASLPHIREAKAAGLQLTASTAPHYLLLSDSHLRDFDSRYKVLPPLREQSDIDALRQAVADGTIDTIASYHQACTQEEKHLEFDFARFGTRGLEVAFAATHTALVHSGLLTLEQLVDRLSHWPRRYLGLPGTSVTEGQPARLTLFDPAAEWTVAPSDILGYNGSSLWPGQTLQGRVLGTVVG
jgi:dihydroorotase